MSPKTETALSSRQRLARGLTYVAVGPVDVTRGAVGLGAHSVQSAASSLRRRYREGQLARDLNAAQEAITQEFAAAQEVVAGLPQALQQARRSKRGGRRPWVIAAAAALVLAGGAAAAFSVIRRSSRPEQPSPRPPSVDVQTKP